MTRARRRKPSVQASWPAWAYGRCCVAENWSDVGDGLQLTDSGRRRAAAFVRSHRLWEAYLVEHLGLPPDHVHDPAERMEHFIDSRLQEQIVADLSDAQRDPHGRDIPGG